jgi:hypothetical protein
MSTLGFAGGAFSALEATATDNDATETRRTRRIESLPLASVPPCLRG